MLSARETIMTSLESPWDGCQMLRSVNYFTNVTVLLCHEPIVAS